MKISCDPTAIRWNLQRCEHTVGTQLGVTRPLAITQIKRSQMRRISNIKI